MITEPKKLNLMPYNVHNSIMKSKPVQIKRVVPEFTEIIPEPGDPEVGLLDFIDSEQPHYHEKFPSDRSEILYEFGDDPTIYIKVNGKIGFAPLDWYRVHKRFLWERYFEVRFDTGRVKP
jgi:hypothetical protein